MHETGIVRDLVRRIEQAAGEAGAERVAGVTVWLVFRHQVRGAPRRDGRCLLACASPEVIL